MTAKNAQPIRNVRAVINFSAVNRYNDFCQSIQDAFAKRSFRWRRYNNEKVTIVDDDAIKTVIRSSRELAGSYESINIQVSESTVIYTTKDYVGFNQLKMDLLSIVDAIQASTPQMIITNITLKYSNILDEIRVLNFDIFINSYLAKIGRLKSNRIKILSNKPLGDFSITHSSKFESKTLIETDLGDLTISTANYTNKAIILNIEHKYNATRKPITQTHFVSSVLSSLHKDILIAFSHSIANGAQKRQWGLPKT